MELGVIGNSEFVLGFRLCGVKKVYVSTDKNFSQKFEEGFSDPEMGIMIVQEELLNTLPNHVKRRVEKTVSPVVVPLSDKGGGDDMRALVKRSLGVDLWK